MLILGKIVNWRKIVDSTKKSWMQICGKPILFLPKNKKNQKNNAKTVFDFEEVLFGGVIS